jgi:hypothetical protein
MLCCLNHAMIDIPAFESGLAVSASIDIKPLVPAFVGWRHHIDSLEDIQERRLKWSAMERCEETHKNEPTDYIVWMKCRAR